MNIVQMQEFRQLRLTVGEHTEQINQLLNKIEELKAQIEMKPKRGRPRKDAD